MWVHWRLGHGWGIWNNGEPLVGIVRVIRAAAASMVAAVFLYLADNTLIYWCGWPGTHAFLAHLNLLPSHPSFTPLNAPQFALGLGQFIVNSAVIAGLCLRVIRIPRALTADAEHYACLAAFIVRAAFWAIFLVGLVDMLISLLRVEDFLPHVVGDTVAAALGRPAVRGTYVHAPLILLAIGLATRTRTLGFIWLALLIVVAEFTIVLTRFVFSYEQAFMGDLVRFWYAGLFLFASAYTLLTDGHVRVDVLYAHFSARSQALTNILGSLLLGLPLCWTILVRGLASKSSLINSPLLSFEISQSGFGMYTKYLMAAYLLVFAVSMAIQFVSSMLSNIATYRAAAAPPMSQT